MYLHKFFSNVKADNENLIIALLELGININVGDYDSRTALHLATCEKNEHMVRFLLQ